jgi:hypothetical protein
MTEEKNYINIDCSKINSRATISLASKIFELLKESYSDGFERYVTIKVKADND